MTNHGTNDITVFKYGSVLDDRFATRSFTVSKDGAVADFTGIKLQIDLESLDDSAFVVIPAGETIVVEHEGELDISSALLIGNIDNVC